MYIEFIIGYVLIGVLALLLAVVIILQYKILKRLSSGSAAPQNTTRPSAGNPYATARGTAICRNCATQFDAAHTVCPRCGTPR